MKTDDLLNPVIVIADPQFLAVNTLTRLIESEISSVKLCVAESRLHLLKLLSSCHHSLLITDFHLFDYSGLDDLLSIVHNYSPSVLVLVNQISCSEISILAKSGIKNIALKTDERHELMSSIEAALRNRKHFSEPVLEMILEQNETRNKSAGQNDPTLTQTEKEIVRLIADGLTTKEIAARKHISVHTVMTHRKNIFRKLEINSISELTRYAIINGLADSPEYNI